MGKCKKHPKGKKGHTWTGSGPDRVCKHCGASPKEPHISTRYEDGPERYEEMMEKTGAQERKAMKGRGGIVKWNNKNGQAPSAKRDRSKK